MHNCLEPYRRHAPDCPHRAKGQNYTKCRCPIWCDGDLGGKRYRRSLKTRDWARAARKIDKLLEKPAATIAAAPTVKAAAHLYLDDCRVRNLAESTVISYRKTLDHLTAFCTNRAPLIENLDLTLLTAFRASRKVAPSTSGKELETLRAFCAFAKKRGWIEDNYAKELAPPKEDGPPTLPFSREEIDAILDACDNWDDRNPNARDATRANARALVLTMLYSGLRISDAVQLRRDAVDFASGKLFLRVMKTGKRQYLRLGGPALEALKALRDRGGKYFFWNGRSELKTAIGLAQRTVSRVMKKAGITEGHPHRFRDTFSVTLLEKGEDLRTVQLLLGHNSIKTTEKHYAPYVESFQRILDGATAKLDFVADSGTKSGTVRKSSRKLLKIG